MGLALMATAFYVFRVSQLSRLLLVYYYLLSVIMIYLKRLVFDRLADAYVRKHDIVPRALLIGGGQLAHRFFRDVIEGRGSTAMQYVGYLDAAPREGLPAYLGTVDSLYELLQTHKVDMIVLAQDVQDVATTQRIMMLADNFHLRVAAVPVYNDYVSSAPRSAPGRHAVRGPAPAEHLRDHGRKYCCHRHGKDRPSTGGKAGGLAQQIHLRGQRPPL